MEKKDICHILGSYTPQRNYPAMQVQIRRKKLRDFCKLLASEKGEIYAAMVADLNRDQTDTLLSELIPLMQIIRFLGKNLPSLSRPRRAAGTITTFPARTKIFREPYGRVLVISTWNYPLLLALEPAIGAFAAGNRVVLKLSPRSAHTNELIKKLIGQVFSGDEIMVINEELTLDEILAFRYDYIFVTGSSQTGKKVYARAAADLIPCTMELGGKNPCIVAGNANLHLAARRIVWGKFFNAGQSCAAPDYLLVDKRIKADFMNIITAEIRRMYGKNPIAADMMACMPDSESYQRIIKISSDGRLICGGDRDPQRFTMEPTVIDRIAPDSPLFTGEIFGPVLPVMEFTGEQHLIEHLCSKERPLAAYCFGGSPELKTFLRREYSCGALIFDDVLLHFSNMNIPFGGVGASGFGAYHGVRTFTTFTHEKPVMTQSAWFDLPLRYPPHSRFFRRIMELFNHLG